jgi:hypothetical protein
MKKKVSCIKKGERQDPRLEKATAIVRNLLMSFKIQQPQPCK